MVSDIGGTLWQIALSDAGIPTLPKSTGSNNVSLTARGPSDTNAAVSMPLQTITNYAQVYIYEQKSQLVQGPKGSSIQWVQVNPI